MSSATIIVGFIVSTVGFSIFLYGRKQKRAPQFLVGLFLLALPLILPDPIPMFVASVVLLFALRLAVNHEW